MIRFLARLAIAAGTAGGQRAPMRPSARIQVACVLWERVRDAVRRSPAIA